MSVEIADFSMYKNCFLCWQNPAQDPAHDPSQDPKTFLRNQQDTVVGSCRDPIRILAGISTRVVKVHREYSPAAGILHTKFD